MGSFRLKIDMHEFSIFIKPFFNRIVSNCKNWFFSVLYFYFIFYSWT